MNRLNIAVLLVFLQLAPLFPQGVSNPQVIYVLVDPSGPCGYGYITVNRTTGNTKGCVSGTWTNISGAIGPTGPAGPTGPSGFPVPTAQTVTSGVTTSVVIPLNGTLTDKSQASPVCVTSAGVYTLAWTSVTNTTTQMTVDFSGTTTAGFTGTCTAVPSIGPVGPTGPTGAAGAGLSGLTANKIPVATGSAAIGNSFLTISGTNGGTLTWTDPTATTGSTLFTITPGAAQTSASTVLSVGGSLSITGSLSAGGGSGLITSSGDFSGRDVSVGGGRFMYWGSSTTLTAPSNGILTLLNFAGSDFGRLQLGGTTSSFPALKRSATAVAFRLADDSADAPITVSTITISGASFLFNGHTCTIVSTVVTCP